ncbi:helix-turn-helix domain-containing protein [Agromyces bauzanensis]
MAEGADLEWALSTLALTEARLTIIRELARREEATVFELQTKLGLGVTTLRWHLKHLEESGLIRTHRVAQTAGRPQLVWQIVPEELERLRDLAGRLI